jgi:hypothetical protein
MLAICRAFGEAARGNRLNLDSEHGHGGECYGESEFLHVNLRRFSNRHGWNPPWRAGAALHRRTPDGSLQCTGTPPATAELRKRDGLSLRFIVRLWRHKMCYQE